MMMKHFNVRVYHVLVVDRSLFNVFYCTYRPMKPAIKKIRIFEKLGNIYVILTTYQSINQSISNFLEWPKQQCH